MQHQQQDQRVAANGCNMVVDQEPTEGGSKSLQAASTWQAAGAQPFARQQHVAVSPNAPVHDTSAILNLVEEGIDPHPSAAFKDLDAAAAMVELAGIPISTHQGQHISQVAIKRVTVQQEAMAQLSSTLISLDQPKHTPVFPTNHHTEVAAALRAQNPYQLVTTALVDKEPIETFSLATATLRQQARRGRPRKAAGAGAAGQNCNAAAVPLKDLFKIPLRSAQRYYWLQHPPQSQRWAVVLTRSNFPARIVLPPRHPGDMARLLLGDSFVCQVESQPEEATSKSKDAVLVDGSQEDSVLFIIYHHTNGRPRYIQRITEFFKRHALQAGDVLHFTSLTPGRLGVAVYKAGTVEAESMKTSINFDNALETAKYKQRLHGKRGIEQRGSASTLKEPSKRMKDLPTSADLQSLPPSFTKAGQPLPHLQPLKPTLPLPLIRSTPVQTTSAFTKDPHVHVSGPYLPCTSSAITITRVGTPLGAPDTSGQEGEGEQPRGLQPRASSGLCSQADARAALEHGMPAHDAVSAEPGGRAEPLQDAHLPSTQQLLPIYGLPQLSGSKFGSPVLGACTSLSLGNAPRGLPGSSPSIPLGQGLGPPPAGMPESRLQTHTAAVNEASKQASHCLPASSSAPLDDCEKQAAPCKAPAAPAVDMQEIRAATAQPPGAAAIPQEQLECRDGGNTKAWTDSLMPQQAREAPCSAFGNVLQRALPACSQQGLQAALVQHSRNLLKLVKAHEQQAQNGGGLPYSQRKVPVQHALQGVTGQQAQQTLPANRIAGSICSSGMVSQGKLSSANSKTTQPPPGIFTAWQSTSIRPALSVQLFPATQGLQRLPQTTPQVPVTCPLAVSLVPANPLPLSAAEVPSLISRPLPLAAGNVSQGTLPSQPQTPMSVLPYLPTTIQAQPVLVMATPIGRDDRAPRAGTPQQLCASAPPQASLENLPSSMGHPNLAQATARLQQQSFKTDVLQKQGGLQAMHLPPYVQQGMPQLCKQGQQVVQLCPQPGPGATAAGNAPEVTWVPQQQTKVPSHSMAGPGLKQPLLHTGTLQEVQGLPKPQLAIRAVGREIAAPAEITAKAFDKARVLAAAAVATNPMKSAQLSRLQMQVSERMKGIQHAGQRQTVQQQQVLCSNSNGSSPVSVSDVNECIQALLGQLGQAVEQYRQRCQQVLEKGSLETKRELLQDLERVLRDLGVEHGFSLGSAAESALDTFP